MKVANSIFSHTFSGVAPSKRASKRASKRGKWECTSGGAAPVSDGLWEQRY